MSTLDWENVLTTLLCLAHGIFLLGLQLFFCTYTLWGHINTFYFTSAEIPPPKTLWFMIMFCLSSKVFRWNCFFCCSSQNLYRSSASSSSCYRPDLVCRSVRRAEWRGKVYTDSIYSYHKALLEIVYTLISPLTTVKLNRKEQITAADALSIHDGLRCDCS